MRATLPFFFPRDRWIPVPASWHPNIVQGKTYAHDEVEGRALWNRVRDSLQGARVDAIADQQGFRVVVTDAYSRREQSLRRRRRASHRQRAAAAA